MNLNLSHAGDIVHEFDALFIGNESFKQVKIGFPDGWHHLLPWFSCSQTQIHRTRVVTRRGTLLQTTS